MNTAHLMCFVKKLLQEGPLCVFLQFEREKGVA